MTTNSNNGNSENFAGDDNTLIQDAYAELPPVQSPSDIDARILAAAHAAVQAPDSRNQNRWLPRVGLAAAIVLAVGATLKMQSVNIEPALDTESTIPQRAPDQQVVVSEPTLTVEPVSAEAEIVEFGRSPTGVSVVEAVPTAPAAARPSEEADRVAFADDEAENNAMAKAFATVEVPPPAKSGDRMRIRERAEVADLPIDSESLMASVERIKRLLADQQVSAARAQWQSLQAARPEQNWDDYFTETELGILDANDDD
ncbi:MAG: hypothetical protein AAGJ86_12905 [Pseudomonadota bacterium]